MDIYKLFPLTKRNDVKYVGVISHTHLTEEVGCESAAYKLLYICIKANSCCYSYITMVHYKHGVAWNKMPTVWLWCICTEMICISVGHSRNSCLWHVVLLHTEQTLWHISNVLSILGHCHLISTSKSLVEQISLYSTTNVPGLVTWDITSINDKKEIPLKLLTRKDRPVLMKALSHWR